VGSGGSIGTKGIALGESKRTGQKRRHCLGSCKRCGGSERVMIS
jgi:hypothetical protein